ncbi:MAG: hypothetical protein ABI051_18400 [Vicinamibacterales bacterium]
MTDTDRVLLTAAVLSSLAVATFAWKVLRTDVGDPDRLIGELRLSQWGAALLAGVAGVPVGLALLSPLAATAGLEAALGVIIIGAAGLILQRDPRDALALVAGGFILHALIDLAHRPGWLSQDLAPHSYVAGCATYNVCLAALCFAVRRRP